MAINPTSLLRHIKMKLGASHRPLPITDEEIMETVYQESLYTFSMYYPFMYNVAVKGKRDAVPGEQGVYYLSEAEGLEVLGVAKMFRGEGYINGGIYPRFTADNAFDMQIHADVTSMIQIPDTFHFHPPNKVEIFPKYVSNHDLLFVVKCIHPKHLGTIPLALREQFFSICELDTKVALWHILKNYDNINTAFGTIQLRLEDLESAEDKRTELLSNWDSKYMYEPGRKRLWIY